MLKGKFDMQDFLEQIRVIQKMGSLRDLFEKMPFFGGQLPEGVNLDDKELVKIEAMISSMTADERKFPERFVVTSWETITNPNGQQLKRRKGADYDDQRVRRVAKGSGRKEQEVKELLNKFAMMRQMMTQMGAQSGLLGKIPGFKQIAQMRNMTKAAAGIDLNQLMSAAGSRRRTSTRIRRSASARRRASSARRTSVADAGVSPRVAPSSSALHAVAQRLAAAQHVSPSLITSRRRPERPPQLSTSRRNSARLAAAQHVSPSLSTSRCSSRYFWMLALCISCPPSQ
jgi:hypothetical protein